MSYLYNNAKKLFLNGSIAFTTTTLKVMLVTASYTADADDVYVSSASSYELTGTGYTSGYGNSGRKTLASKTVTVDNTLDRAVCDAADLTWTAITAGTVAAALVVYETGGSDATALLVQYCDLPRFVTDGTDYVLTWPSTGVFYLS